MTVGGQNNNRTIAQSNNRSETKNMNYRYSIDDLLNISISLLTVLFQSFRARKSSFVPFSVSVLLWHKAISFILLNEYKKDSIYPSQIGQINENISQICMMASNRFVFHHQTNSIKQLVAKFATTVKENLTLANIFKEREEFQFVRNTY